VNGIFGQLGFIPPELKFDALGLSPHGSEKHVRKQHGLDRKITFIRNSDAHYLKQIGEICTVFRHSHLDRPPLGDIWEVWYFILIRNPGVRLIYRYTTDKGIFQSDSEELLTLLSGVSPQQKEIRNAVIEWIKNNLEDIEASN
jgi:hypothetical protein